MTVPALLGLGLTGSRDKHHAPRKHGAGYRLTESMWVVTLNSLAW